MNQHTVARTSRGRSGRSRHSGFSLVEVLVSIMILSFGVLGSVGMQAAAMRSNKEVRLQALAGSLSRELAEKMRGNNLVAIGTTAVANPYLLGVTLLKDTTVTVPAVNCFTANCTTGAAIAAWDIYDWQLRVKDALPSARVLICMDETPFTAAGLPEWDCSNTGNVAVLKLAWNRANEKGETQFTSAAATIPLLVLPLTAGSSQ